MGYRFFLLSDSDLNTPIANFHGLKAAREGKKILEGKGLKIIIARYSDGKTFELSQGATGPTPAQSSGWRWEQFPVSRGTPVPCLEVG